ncbi:MAG: hypothetical protein M1542_05815 [Thermotogae bacterium]|jgi:hypothetical protein|nr:hypothetical protein [Thermotogota bacterium]
MSGGDTLDYRRESQRISEISEGAILGGLTALIYTMQLIAGIGTVVSYLSLIPLVYAGERSFSEWIKVIVVSTIFVFAFNDLGGALFFVLFIVPLSLSLILRFNNQSLSISSSPIFVAIVLILSRFPWIVGFTISRYLNDFWANFWVIFAFIFVTLTVEIFSRFIHNIIEKFEVKSNENPKIPDVILLFLDTVIIITVYGLSLPFVFTVSTIFLTFLFELTYTAIKKESIRVAGKILEYIVSIIKHVY